MRSGILRFLVMATAMFGAVAGAQLSLDPADARLRQALVDICPSVSAGETSLSEAALAQGWNEARIPNRRIRRDLRIEQSFAAADAPGVYLFMFGDDCGVAIIEGEPVERAQRSQALVLSAQDHFEGGVTIVTTIQRPPPPGNSMAAFDFYAIGAEPLSARWVWAQTVNTLRNPGEMVIMTLDRRPPSPPEPAPSP
jgi:hypothetical protein